MKVKKVIAIIVALAITVGAAVGGIYGYKSYQKKNLVAAVQSVASLNYGYYGDSETSYGIVTNDSSQDVYLDDSNKVKEVYVSKGDTVSEGDPLIQYDTSEAEIDIQRKNLEISTTENSLAKAEHALETLKNTKPVDKTRPSVDTSTYKNKKLQELEQKEAYIESLPEKDSKDSRIYNYVTEDSKPYNIDTADGTAENPYIYYCNKDVYAYGSFYNSLRPKKKSDGTYTDGKYVKFIICKKDSKGKMKFESVETGDEVVDDSTESDGTTKEVTVQRNEPVADNSVSPNVKDVDGSTIPMDYDESRTWYVFSGEEVGKSFQDLLDEIEQEQDWEEPEGYTEKELANAINDKEAEVKKLDIQLRKLKLELETLQDSIDDGVVYAKLDGVVKSVGDPDQKQDDGNAFLVVTGDDGLYVSGTISELLLDEVKPGTVVTANSWESGMTFQATVTSISDYPVSGNSWGEGNPNVSYYQYTAYMEDSSALKNGEYVDLSIQTNQSQTGGIYLDKAYVRQEDGKSYVMMADENNQLKKQYVVTGKTVYGTAIEIKSGLTENDKIAFPYGKTAVEGAAVTEDEDIEY